MVPSPLVARGAVAGRGAALLSLIPSVSVWVPTSHTARVARVVGTSRCVLGWSQNPSMQPEAKIAAANAMARLIHFRMFVLSSPIKILT